MSAHPLKRSVFVGMIIFSLQLAALPASVSANDWVSLQRAKPYRGLTPVQAQQRRRAQILHYLQQQELRKSSTRIEKQAPVPDSRFPESYRALSDYYKTQVQQSGETNEK